MTPVRFGLRPGSIGTRVASLPSREQPCAIIQTSPHPGAHSAFGFPCHQTTPSRSPLLNPHQFGITHLYPEELGSEGVSGPTRQTHPNRSRKRHRAEVSNHQPGRHTPTDPSKTGDRLRQHACVQESAICQMGDDRTAAPGFTPVKVSLTRPPRVVPVEDTRQPDWDCVCSNPEEEVPKRREHPTSQRQEST